MAKLQMSGNGELHDVMNRVHQSIVNLGETCELVDQFSQSSSTMQVEVRVYEMYFMRTSSRCTLTVIYTQQNNKIKTTAISSGGGTGLLFRWDLGSENKFLKPVERALTNMGFC